MFHFCQDEALALATTVPFLGFAFRWARVKLGMYAKKTKGHETRLR